jgi:hypothetical protein
MSCLLDLVVDYDPKRWFCIKVFFNELKVFFIGLPQARARTHARAWGKGTRGPGYLPTAEGDKGLGLKVKETNQNPVFSPADTQKANQKPNRKSCPGGLPQKAESLRNKSSLKDD